MEYLIEWGYIGLFIGSFVAATVFPLSSDVLMVGILFAGGNIATTVLVATMGNWLGGMTSYYVGWIGKWEWIEKWFKVSREKLERQKVYIDRFGLWLALGSWLPIVGDLFAIALGFYRVNIVKAGLLMLVGKFARFMVWGILFYYFG